jgi:hypothetical protein
VGLSIVGGFVLFDIGFEKSTVVFFGMLDFLHFVFSVVPHSCLQHAGLLPH